MSEKDVKQSQDDTADDEIQWLFDVDDRGRFIALLPCGKRPVIKGMLPGTLRNIYSAFPQPEAPMEKLPVPGTGMAQTLRNENDPQYREALWEWWRKTRHAMMTRIVTDCLIVPEDADFVRADEPYIAHPTCSKHCHLGNDAKWKRMGWQDEEVGASEEECTCVRIKRSQDWSIKLRMANMPVPQNGVDRQVAYAQEALPELFENSDDQFAIMEAVRQLTVPTEASIMYARKRFQDALAWDIPAGDEDGEGEHLSEP
jgi:hypothetical protein